METKANTTQIAWAQIVGMRNHLVHGYVFVDWDIVAVTVGDNFPPLIEKLEAILYYE